MDPGFKVESGLQLLARLSKRPSLVGLDKVLFPDGPNPNEVIEISGDPSSGKTFFITKFIMKTILPAEYQNIHIGGLNAGIVLINMDYHFQMFKLISFMEHYLENCTSESTTTDNISKLDTVFIQTIISESLNNLIIYNCVDTIQLLVTFHAIQNLISKNSNISLVLIDSISANYWIDAMNGGIRKMDLYSKDILEELQKCLHDFKLVIIYTQPSYFQSKTRKHEVCSIYPGFGKVTQCIQLQVVSTEDSVYCAEVVTSNITFSRMYTFNSVEIRWAN